MGTFSNVMQTVIYERQKLTEINTYDHSGSRIEQRPLTYLDQAFCFTSLRPIPSYMQLYQQSHPKTCSAGFFILSPAFVNCVRSYKTLPFCEQSGIFLKLQMKSGIVL